MNDARNHPNGRVLSVAGNLRGAYKIQARNYSPRKPSSARTPCDRPPWSRPWHRCQSRCHIRPSRNPPRMQNRRRRRRPRRSGSWHWWIGRGRSFRTRVPPAPAPTARRCHHRRPSCVGACGPRMEIPSRLSPHMTRSRCDRQHDRDGIIATAHSPEPRRRQRRMRTPSRRARPMRVASLVSSRRRLPSGGGFERS